MSHFEQLIQMYAKAPIHDFYQHIKLTIEKEKSQVALPIDQRYFHGGMSVHGSVYFKLMDDAAYFACQSMITDYFIVTTGFNIQLLRPITGGKIIAHGKADFISRNLFSGSAELYDEKGRLCGKGQGQFVKSKLALENVETYQSQ